MQTTEQEQLTKLDRFTKEVGDIISPAFITTDPYEIEATSADLSLLPKYHYKFKEEFRATHVVRLGTTEQLSKVMQKCREYSFPVTIRAAGTSCYSPSSPTQGGVVIDVRRMNKVHNVDAEKMTIKCDGGISWLRLIAELLTHGLTPRCYPTSYKSGCLAGYVVTTGKAGIGSVKYGSIREALISVTMVKPDGSIEIVTKNSKGDLTLDDVVESLGIYGAIAEVEMKVEALKPTMEMVGYGFNTIETAMQFFSKIKNYNGSKPYFLSLSDKKFEKLSHKTIPTRKFFVYAVFSDESEVCAKAVSFVKDTADQIGGLGAEDWYLKEKWNDIADTELNLGRQCRNPVFQEYWIGEERCQAFYEIYHEKTKMLDYSDAFYMMAGAGGANRIKIFGLSDIADSREFFGIKSYFNLLSLYTFNQHDRLYTIGVVNTFYFIKFFPQRVEEIKALKKKLDPDNLVNSHRFTLAKMKYWRIQLLFLLAKWLFRIA